MCKLAVRLLFSVIPWFGGQNFIPATLDKLARARLKIDAWMRAGGQPIALEVDGGVKIDNIADIRAAGADTFVAGSAIFGHPDYREIIAALRAEITRGESISI